MIARKEEAVTGKEAFETLRNAQLTAKFFTILLTVLLCLWNSFAAAAPTLSVSSSATRSSPIALSNAVLAGNAYIFLASPTNVVRTDFYLDAPPPSAIWSTERLAPIDFNGTNPDDTAKPFNTQTLSDGQHTIYAKVYYQGGANEVMSAAFTVNNSLPALQFSQSSIRFSVSEDNPQTQVEQVTLSTTEETPSTISLSDNANWLTVSPTSGTAPFDVSLTADPNGLSPGDYSAVVEATGDGVSPATLQVNLTVVAAPNGEYDILVSTSADRSSATGLQGASVSGDIFAFVPTQSNITRVEFYINNPQQSGSPSQTERLAPFDMAGTAANNAALPFDTTSLSDGNHTVTVKVVTSNSGTHVVTVFFTVANDVASLAFGQNSLAGSRHINNPEPVVQSVDLNASDGSNAAYSLSSNAAWLSGSGDTGSTPASITVTANPQGLGAGTHQGTLTASANGYAAGNLQFTLTITEGEQGILASPTSMAFSGQPESPIASQTLTVSHAQNNQDAFTVSTNMPWLSASPTSGTTPQSIQVSVDSAGMVVGNYNAILTITSAGNSNVDVPVTLSLQSDDKCAPVACSDVRVELPYQLTFTEGQGFYMDSNGWGTGFTWIDEPSAGTGYIPGNLSMNFLQGVLNLTTTSGIQFREANSLDNALAVGFAAPNQITHISTQILDVPAGTGNYEQAGMWFGNDEDNYIKLVVVSAPNGQFVHYIMELNGATPAEKFIAVPGLVGSDITLSMTVDPYNRDVGLSYQKEGGATIQVATLSPPDEFFSFDAAGIDPEIGTRSFTGIMATHRNGASPITYKFDEFTLEEGGGPISPVSGIDFVRKSFNVDFPTSMVWGPDDRLYVTELFGTVHALAFDQNMNLINDQVINSLVNSVGPRLTLGITISPFSTPSNVELWVAHSSPSIDNGEANSGMVSRLGGQNFQTVEHVITGLPRAIANHSINSIHFGPNDNRLYIAMGGNTGAGAPNQSNSEFGQRAEQPLSAAIIVADVFAASFDGTCANNSNIYGPPPCDVVTYATGLRNSYDFVFHSNGRMYATDNGLGVTGTYPPKPQPVCTGFGNTASYQNGGHNPGAQPDLLLLIEDGSYYGHPNPYRDECVFKDGSYQGVAPLPNYEPPLFNLGDHKSSNAIIEYSGVEGCVGEFLNNQLLITNYSVGDDIFRVLLNETGTGVVEGGPLVGGFNDPLPLAQAPNGTLFVGEFGGNKLTTLQPISLGCWQFLAPMPTPILDAAGAAINGKMYVVAGKNSGGHQSTLWIYNTANNSWSQGTNLPGVGVENPAVVAHNGLLYAFGGSTDPFSGAVSNAAVYNPATDSWTTLASLPTARGGATAQSLNGLIYVIGGMNSQGASLATVEVFNPQNGTWQTGASLQTRRDNPGSAVVNGELYVFGGRIRNADGSTTNGTLTSVEMYNPGAGTWQAKTPMPTGRRAMSVGVIDGKVVVAAGENNPNSPSGVFDQNEEYDPVSNSWRALSKVPTPKHGAASATIGGKMYIVGGGITSGSSFTSSMEAFQF